MNISCFRNDLDFVRKIVYNVSSEYMSALHNNFYFDALISEAVVNIYPSNKSITSGICSISPFERKLELNIVLKDSEKYIAFIVAHEFAHLLFTNLHDPLHLSGLASDRSTNYTAICRMKPDGSVYGNQLEELIADYLAYYIVGRMNFEDKNDKYKQEFEKCSFGFYIIQTLEYPFGRSLFECNFIDEQYKEDEEVQYSIFWNAILSFSFNIVVDDFDEIMGSDKFIKFNENLEEYYKDPCDENRKKITDMLTVFLEKTS